MNTIFRCHIKNEERLGLLRRAMQSWKDKGLDTLGQLYIVDDQSPMQAEVESLAAEFSATYKRTDPPGGTKNGLYWSLKIQNEFPVLCCTDDMVFGQGTKDALDIILKKDFPNLPSPGMVGMFACYDHNTRHNLTVGTSHTLWGVPIGILYALVCHMFSKELADIAMRDYERMLSGEIPMSGWQDDIWIKELCRTHGLHVYNTRVDYAYHTGIHKRTFGDDPVANSNYQTPLFVGE